MELLTPAVRRGLRLGWQVSLRGMLALLLTTLHGLQPAWAQPPAVARESAVKAAFLSKFGGFVEWPDVAAPRARQPLVIGVVGNDAVAADLEQLVGVQVPNGALLELRRLQQGESTQGLHVLFIGAGRDERVSEMIAAARGPVLVVTEQDNGLRLGATLNFVGDQGRVRFAASVAAAEARGLRLSARLLAVAFTVERGR